MSRLARLYNPAEFQGVGVTKRYFEGWYFKQVDASAQRTVAIIPGVSLSADGSHRHSFVQVVPSPGEAHYFSAPIGEFGFTPGRDFSVNVGASTFGCSGFRLDLADEVRRVTGEIRFGPMRPWPITTLSPGIMGWYRFVPRMETYHAVISMDHGVDGWIEIDGDRIDFDDGRGYAEKDWGRSFPSSWIWAQSNHFEKPATSLMLSVAKVPWMTGAFVGNIAGLLAGGELHRFATYTGARLSHLSTSHGEASITLADKRQELEVHLKGSDTLTLKAPVLGAMEGKDAESLDGTMEVTLRTLRGARAGVTFRGIGRRAGVEIMNERDELR